MKTFTICPIPNIPHEDERLYAFFYPGDYATITGRPMNQSSKVKRFICVSYNRKKEYKQFLALNGIPKGSIGLKYESKCNLGVTENDVVNVSSISKFCYTWHTSDSIAKLSLLLALCSLVFSLLFVIF